LRVNTPYAYTPKFAEFYASVLSSRSNDDRKCSFSNKSTVRAEREAARPDNRLSVNPAPDTAAVAAAAFAVQTAGDVAFAGPDRHEPRLRRENPVEANRGNDGVARSIPTPA